MYFTQRSITNELVQAGQWRRRSRLLQYRLRRAREEAVRAQGADAREQIFQLSEYVDQGNKDAELWWPILLKNSQSSATKNLASGNYAKEKDLRLAIKVLGVSV
jgi:hypothetical protein